MRASPKPEKNGVVRPVASFLLRRTTSRLRRAPRSRSSSPRPTAPKRWSCLTKGKTKTSAAIARTISSTPLPNSAPATKKRYRRPTPATPLNQGRKNHPPPPTSSFKECYEHGLHTPGLGRIFYGHCARGRQAGQLLPATSGRPNCQRPPHHLHRLQRHPARHRKLLRWRLPPLRLRRPFRR
jgi:hypothetical protein